MANISRSFDLNVFINCPFDKEYQPLFEAIVFTVQLAGLRPRCALEANNAGEARLEKTMNILAECRYSIHDLSRTELGKNGLPRFNMPLELGLDLGCRKFGTGMQRSKRLLIMDKSRYRYQRFISDIAGQDITPHRQNSRQVIRCVRDWLSLEHQGMTIAGGSYVANRYRTFQNALPPFCQSLKLNPKQLTFGDFCMTVGLWLEEKEK